MVTFEEFWNAYDKKVGRKKALQLWGRLSNETKIAIMDHVPFYVASTPDKQFRKNPETYLRGECWEDEIIEQMVESRFYTYDQIIKKVTAREAVMSDFEKTPEGWKAKQ